MMKESQSTSGKEIFLKVVDEDPNADDESKHLKTVVYDSRRLIKGLCFLIIAIIIGTFILDVTLRRYIDETHVGTGDGPDHYATMRDARDDIVHTGIAYEHADLKFDRLVTNMPRIKSVSYIGIVSPVHAAVLTGGGAVIDLHTPVATISVTKDDDVGIEFRDPALEEAVRWTENIRDDQLREGSRNGTTTCMDRLIDKCDSFTDARARNLCQWSCGDIKPTVFM